LKDDVLRYVFDSEGRLAKLVNECPKRLVSFLPDVEEGQRGGLVRVASCKLGRKEVGEGVEAVYGI